MIDVFQPGWWQSAEMMLNAFCESHAPELRVVGGSPSAAGTMHRDVRRMHGANMNRCSIDPHKQKLEEKPAAVDISALFKK